MTYVAPPRCGWGWRFSYRADACVPWDIVSLYPTYRDESAVGIAIIADVAASTPTAQPLADYGAQGFGLFTPEYGDDTRNFMEQSAIRAMVDYMAELKYTVDPDSAQILNEDTRGSLDILYVAGSAKLPGNEDIYWLVRTSTSGDTRVIYIRSDEYGDFVSQ